jgi:hypothetical protein
MAEALTVILTLVGIGILVVGIMLLLQLRSGVPAAAAAPATVVVQESPRYWRHGWPRRYPLGPYYSHLPVRPLLY